MKTEDSEKNVHNQRRRLAMTVLGVSLALHGGLALLAGVWIVAKHFSTPSEPPPTLTAKPLQKPPAKVREQLMQAAASEGVAHKAAFTDRIQSTRVTSLALPDLPRLPAFSAPTLETGVLSPSFLSEATALAESAGAGVGRGTGGAGANGTGVNFLGVQTQAKRIVLMFDISKTVAGAAAKAGMPMERIRDETERLMHEMGVNTRFGLVEFARNYAFFRPELVPSTDANRKAALAWLHTFFATEGTLPRGLPNVVSGSPGFLVALEAAFKLQPDTLFILSDGSLQRGTGASSTIPIPEIEQTLLRLQTSQPYRAKVFFVGVGVAPETEKALRRVLASAGSGGTFSEIKRESAPR
jgi:hypothetical protein